MTVQSDLSSNEMKRDRQQTAKEEDLQSRQVTGSGQANSGYGTGVLGAHWSLYAAYLCSPVSRQ